MVSFNSQLKVGNCGFGSRDGMRSFIRRILGLSDSNDGLTSSEYAVMLALLIMVCISAAQTLGCATKITFSNVASSMGN
jgi:pilus assembly protein Flp/PilA